MTLTFQFAKAFAAATQPPGAVAAASTTPPEGPNPELTVSTVNFAELITDK